MNEKTWASQCLQHEFALSKYQRGKNVPFIKKLSDQVLVLTGATSGIGLSTARRAARRGARLVLAARNEDALRELRSQLARDGAQAVHVIADVGTEDEVRRIADMAIAHFGRIDTWINNAGVSIFGRHEQVAPKDMRRLFETNFWGVVYGSLIALPYLKLRGGTLINVGSGLSDRAVPLQGMYSASKHAVKAFTDSLRMELEEEGAPVSVTLIKPSSINSMLIEHARNYLAVRPRLPPPVYAPDIVAKAILYAAEHPVRDIYAGGAAKLLALGANHMPRLLDCGMQWLMFRWQKTDQKPYPEFQNNLYSAGTDLQERGPTDAHVFERSWYTEAVTSHRAKKTAFLAAGIALAVLLNASRSSSRVSRRYF